jgi:hypothetical protein
MNGLIYLIGLIVVIMFTLSFLGLRWPREASEFAMTYTDRADPSAVAAADTPAGFRYIQWGPVIAGALLAAALALVLQAFGIGLGLSMSSAAPTWRS